MTAYVVIMHVLSCQAILDLVPVLSLHGDLIQKNSRLLKKQIVWCTELMNVHIQKQTCWSDRYSDSSDPVQKQQILAT